MSQINSDPNEDPDFIEKSETDLYGVAKPSPGFEPKSQIGTSFKLRSPMPKTSVSDLKTSKRKYSFAKKFFIISLVLLIFAALYTTYRLFFSESRQDFISRHIDITVKTAPFTKGGEELPVSVTVVNRNNVTLTNVYAEIEYPRGSFAETRDDFERQTIDLGDIPSGAESTKNISVILYGEQGSKKDINVRVDYSLPDSSLTYSKTGASSLTISSSPVIVEVDAPKDIAPGQLYTLRARIIQNTKTLPEGSLLNVAYPRDFTPESVSRKVDYGVSTWVIKTAKEGDYEDLTITGRFSSQEGDERSFRFTVGVPLPDDATSIKTSYVSKAHVVSLARPLLDAYILLGNERAKTIAINPDSYVQGTLVYRNRYSNAVIDPVFRIKIEGTALDEFSILPVEGFYDSVKKEIFWDKNTREDLSSIKPNSEGRLNFSFRVLPRSIDSPKVVREPYVNLSLSLSGTPDDANLLTQNLENIESASVRVTTEPSIDVSLIHASGPLPPKVANETVYQVTLSVENTHNDITGARYTMKLPFYVRWVGKVTREEKIAYNPDTREVIWSLGNVTAGTGITTASRIGEFQIAITPSLSQLESAPEILQTLRFTGTDIFSNKDVKSQHANVNTRVTNGISSDALVVQ